MGSLLLFLLLLIYFPAWAHRVEEGEREIACRIQMAGIRGLLQLMGGRHYMKTNTLPSSQLRWQEQQEPDAKEPGTGLFLLFCQAGCQGRGFERGVNGAWPAPEQAGRYLVSGVHIITTSSHSRTRPHKLMDKCTHFTRMMPSGLPSSP